MKIAAITMVSPNNCTNNYSKIGYGNFVNKSNATDSVSFTGRRLPKGIRKDFKNDEVGQAYLNRIYNYKDKNGDYIYKDSAIYTIANTYPDKLQKFDELAGLKDDNNGCMLRGLSEVSLFMDIYDDKNKDAIDNLIRLNYELNSDQWRYYTTHNSYTRGASKWYYDIDDLVASYKEYPNEFNKLLNMKYDNGNNVFDSFNSIKQIAPLYANHRNETRKLINMPGFKREPRFDGYQIAHLLKTYIKFPEETDYLKGLLDEKGTGYRFNAYQIKELVPLCILDKDAVRALLALKDNEQKYVYDAQSLTTLFRTCCNAPDAVASILQKRGNYPNLD